MLELALSLFSYLGDVQVLVIAGVVILAWKYLTASNYNLPPGPYPLPLLGNITEFRKISIFEKLSEWSKKFGPVITFYVGPKRVVVLNTPEVVAEAFVSQGSDFSGRPYLYSLAQVSDGNKDITFAQYGELWKYQRRIATQALRQYLTGSQLEHRVHEALQQVTEVLLSEKGAFNPHKHLSLSIFNILHGLCFGKTMSFTDPSFLKVIAAFDNASEQFGNGFAEDFIPPLRWWPTKRYETTLEAMKSFNEYIHKQYDEHKDNFDSDNINSLTDQIILTHQTIREENPALAAQFTETHAVHIMGDVFGAGLDTSRVTLDWFFLMMAIYPDVQKKIQKEIDEVIGSEIPGKEHRSRLVHLEAALLETIRLHYVVPLGVPHETMRDTTVGGYDIPAKTLVVTNTYGIMHDPELWEEPMVFRPERFMSETEDKLIARHKGWFPFSMGQRACLGESLAKLELVYIIAGLLQVVSFNLPSGVQPDFSKVRIGITNMPIPYEVIVTLR